MVKVFLKYRLSFIVLFLGVSLTPQYSLAEEKKSAENPSNPLAAASNLDMRAKYFDLGEGYDRYTYSLEGATMLHPKLKLKVELHYWDTDVTGSNENDWESLVIKPILFVNEGVHNAMKYRVAVGFDWVHDFDNKDKGIGGSSSTIAPFLGLALGVSEKTTVIPLVQHYLSYDGDNVNQTALRFIGMQKLPQQMWLKLDAKFPIDWQHDKAIPASVELQWGKMFNTRFGAYIDGLAGIGGDRSYDYGIGVGVRTMF